MPIFKLNNKILQDKTFKDPNVMDPINDFNLPFKDYIKKYHKILKETREDLHTENADFIIDANLPFELYPDKPSKIGVLLIHGLFDSPFIMKDLGLYLKEKGYLVRAIVLPGHSIKPAALLNVRFEDWVRTVAYGVHSLSKDVEKIYLVGVSTGATLSVYHELTKHNIAGLILLAPAFKINSRFAFLTGFFTFLGKKWARLAWASIQSTVDYVKYLSFPFNSAHQLNLLIKSLKKCKNKKPSCPLLFVLSMDDQVVNVKIAMEYFTRWRKKEDELILYSNKITSDNNITHRPAYYKAFGIKSFSHASLPIAPHNTYYGQKGTCSYASKVRPEIFYKSMSCFETFVRKILFKLHLGKEYRRLTYNPDFAFMAQKIAEFIHRTS